MINLKKIENSRKKKFIFQSSFPINLNRKNQKVILKVTQVSYPSLPFLVQFLLERKGWKNMVKIEIDKQLKKNQRSKYWLCQRMNMTSRNLNRIIRGETSSISFKYIEEFCTLLNCTPGELIIVSADENAYTN